MPSTVERSRKLENSAPSSSPERCRSVVTRQWSCSSSPSNSPKTVCVFPTSIARSAIRRGYLDVVVGGERLADPLGQRFGGHAGLVALAAELLDGHVARGVDLGARDDPGRAVL